MLMPVNRPKPGECGMSCIICNAACCPVNADFGEDANILRFPQPDKADKNTQSEDGDEIL